MSSLPPLEGTIWAKPLAGAVTEGSNGLAAAPITVGAPPSGSITGDLGESPESTAVAELSGLISTIGSLSAQAQSLPLSPPSLPGIPQNSGYRPQTTDYLQFAEGAD